MKICKVCKTENEEEFVYCKNCGFKLEAAPTFQKEYDGLTASDEAGNTIGLVPVVMMLPDPNNPDNRIPQAVYVTPAQRAAIQYEISKLKGNL